MKIFHIWLVGSLCIAQTSYSMQTATRFLGGSAAIGVAMIAGFTSLISIGHGLQSTNNRDIDNLSNYNSILSDRKKGTLQLLGLGERSVTGCAFFGIGSAMFGLSILSGKYGSALFRAQTSSLPFNEVARTSGKIALLLTGLAAMNSTFGFVQHTGNRISALDHKNRLLSSLFATAAGATTIGCFYGFSKLVGN